MSTVEPPVAPLLPDPPGPRLSPRRVLAALLLVALVGGGAFLLARHAATDRATRAEAASLPATWFAPYVDATLSPSVAFQDRGTNPARDIVLGFVVADATAGEECTPSWGTYASLGQAATQFDLDRRIAQVRGQGGDAIVSFGGQANRELAVACTGGADLAKAYRSVVDRYATDTVDFDVEGTAIANSAANARRAAAVRVVQGGLRHAKRHLAVWLTLPVTPDGLDAGALAVVRDMLAAKVDLAGVNIMAMDFGTRSASRDLRKAITSSIVATRKQLTVVYARAGVHLNGSQLWRKLGVTVMIGQNDIDGERLSVADARAVAGFATAHGLGRVSMWSLNRDAPCGATFAVLGAHSNFCSGVAQKPLQFSTVLATLKGTAAPAAAAVTTTDVPTGAASSTTVDDPAKSPYPIWEPELAYRAGYKIVWHQAVYVAKYYAQGKTPDAASAAGANPWRLVGPVLASDRAPKIPRLPASTYPAWSVSKVFRAGARILYHGLPYRASWYTTGDVPGGMGRGGTASPWTALFTIPGEPAPG